MRATILRRIRAADPGLLVVLVATALLTLAYAFWSVQRYRWFLPKGYDLGIFDQAAWHIAHLEYPATTLRVEPNLWGDHLHPIISVWGALRAIWPSVYALLVSQALIVAAAMIPLYLVARDRVGRTAGVLVALAFGTAWGVQKGVAFDVHEVAFAPLLLASAVLAADRRSDRWYWVAVALLLLVKEDMSLVVVSLGLWLLATDQRRRGAITVAVGVAWFFLATRVIIPAFADGRAFQYWTYGSLGDDAPSAVMHLLTHPWQLWTVSTNTPVKVDTIVALLAPWCLILPFLTRLAILPIPLLLERFLSDNPNFWNYEFHYSLVPTMALALAAIGGIATVQRLVRRGQGWWAARSAATAPASTADAPPPRAASRRAGGARRPSVVRVLPAALAAVGLLVGTVFWSTTYPVGTAPLAAMARLSGPPKTVDRSLLQSVVDAVPRTGTVSGPQLLLPHMTGRGQGIYLLQSPQNGAPAGVEGADNVALNVVDTPGIDPFGSGWDATSYLPFSIVERRLATGTLVPLRVFRDGWAILRDPRAPDGTRPDPQLGALDAAAGRPLRSAVQRWNVALRRILDSCGSGSCAPNQTAAWHEETTKLLRAMASAPVPPGSGCALLLERLVPTLTELDQRFTTAGRTPTPDAQAAITISFDHDVASAPRRVALMCAPGAAGAKTIAPGPTVPQ